MIEVKNVEFSYSKRDYAIKGVSFVINEGEWVSIIGHNGSGKSTISKLLVGLLEANKGSIMIDGLEVNEANINLIRRNIGIVFQNPDNQFVGVTVKHDIAFGLENRNVPRKEMLELIDYYSEKVHMEKYLDSEPGNLSGGQKQRVAIAGILALDAKYIILDEATSMLDPEGTKDIINIIRDLNKTHNKTVITITHDLNFAYLSDRIIVLNDGLKILDDNPHNVFQEVDKLKDASLDIPFNLRLYNMALKDEDLCKNDKVVKALCSLSSKI